MATGTSPKPASLSGFILHLHPRTVPAETIRFTLSFGLGGMSATLFLILLFTGILQLLSYSAAVESAHQSIIAMYAAGSLAGFVRNIHHWAGNLLVIVCVLHLLRVYLTGAADRTRRLNWLIGICLLLLVLFANFTGYLLPWDQLSYWAVTIFTNMAGYMPLIGAWLSEVLSGGGEVGPTTLATFFAIHVGLVPSLMVILLIFHFWLIRKAGGLVRDQDLPPERISAVPALISREAAVGLGLTGLLLLFAALVDAPLADIANPGESPNPAKAAWYFLGLQELLLHLHPTFAICIIPLLMLVLLALLPFITGTNLPPGIWCGGDNGWAHAAAAWAIGFGGAIPLIMLDDLVLKSADGPARAVPWIGRGVVPLAAIAAAFWLVYRLLRRRRTSRPKSAMILVMLVFGMLCGLTAAGVWLRGAGMVLTLPF